MSEIIKIYLEEIKDVNIEFVDYQPYKSIYEMQKDYGLDVPKPKNSLCHPEFISESEDCKHN